MKKLKVRIIGAGPTGLLLANSLAKLNINVHIYDLLSKDQLLVKDKTYAITHSSKLILEKFDIWNQLEPHIYSFKSLLISDSFIRKSSLFSSNDLPSDLSYSDDIGWVVKHSVLTETLIKKLSNYENVNFINKNPDLSLKSDFDYEFYADGANSVYKKSYGLFTFKRSYEQYCLTFKVLLRGTTVKRAYEIFRDEGPLALLPLSNNLYQVIWTSNKIYAKKRMNSSECLLLDNLSASLPKDFKVDQIIGDIKSFPVALSLTVPIFNFKKHIFVGDSLHTFHPVGGQGLNSCWRDVDCIYNYLNRNIIKSKKSILFFKFYFYWNRFIDIFSVVFTTHSLITIFANNNIFLIPIRLLSFFFLRKSKFVRKMVLSYMTKSLSFNSIKH